MSPWISQASIQLASETAIQNVFNKSRFSGTRHTGHHDKQTQRERNIDVFEIVLARSEYRDRLAVGMAAFVRNRDRKIAGDVTTRQRRLVLCDVLRRSLS